MTMEFILDKPEDKTERSIRITIKDADTTLLTPIIERLNLNKDVKIVRFIETHPELDDRKLYVEMYNGDTIQAIKEAADDISEYFGKITQ